MNQDRSKETTRVHLANAFNSTMFTDCCGCAVCNDELKCPSCNAEVYPYDEGELNNHQRGAARWKIAYNCR